LEFFPTPGEQYRIPVDDLRYEALLSNVTVLPIPTFDAELHQELNKFTDLIHRDDIGEPTITAFLANCPELLELAFGCRSIKSQALLEWQSASEIPNLRPDFMIERMDGYFDIVEFKLPQLKSKPTVGTLQRRRPSHEVDSAIAQLETYDDWFGERINREWLRQKYGIKALNPQRWLVMGMKGSFPDDDRRRLRKTRNTVVYTYDEFIGLVRHQLYRVR
jgi:hypothetical protein